MAIAFTCIETAKLNNVDPQAWLTGVLDSIAAQGPDPCGTRRRMNPEYQPPAPSQKTTSKNAVNPANETRPRQIL